VIKDKQLKGLVLSQNDHLLRHVVPINKVSTVSLNPIDHNLNI